MKLEIDIDDVAAKEIAKLERKIERLQDALAKCNHKNKLYEEQFKGIAKAREALIEVAYLIDPYYGDDD